MIRTSRSQKMKMNKNMKMEISQKPSYPYPASGTSGLTMSSRRPLESTFNAATAPEVYALIYLFVFLLVSILSSSPAFGKGPGSGGSNGFWEPRLRAGFMAGDSSNHTDYFLNVMAPLAGTERELVFFDLTTRLDDNDGNELNLGLGWRAFLGEDFVGGMNFFFDTMESEHNVRYAQLGFGVELLSNKYFDLRANFYEIMSSDDEAVIGEADYQFGSTSLLVSQGVEEALGGIDAEVGFLVPFISRYMETRAYVGGFWLDSDIVKDSDLRGLKYRIEARPSRFISLNVDVTRDELRGTDTFVGGYIEIPFSLDRIFRGKSPFITAKDDTLGRGVRPLKARMSDKVERDRHIRTRSFKSGYVPYENFADLIYVSADNSSGTEDGSLEHPWNHVSDLPGDARFDDGVWVYVFSEDDTADVYNNVSLDLPDNSVFWGQGYRFRNLGGDGPRPVLEGTGYWDEAVLTLGDNNEVMGLEIANGGYGIYGEDITTAYIHDNTLWGNRSGVYLINRGSGDMDFRVEENTIIGNESGVSLSNEGSGSADVKIERNYITRSFAGVSVHNSGSGTLTIEAKNNYIGDSIDVGVLYNNSGSGILNGLIVDNTITRGNSGVDFANDTGGTLNAKLVGNMITDNGVFGVTFYNFGLGTLEMEGNTMTNRAGIGVYIFNWSIAQLTAKLTRNTFTGFTFPVAVSNGGGIVNISLEENTLTGNGNGYGVSLFADHFGGPVFATIESNTITGYYRGIDMISYGVGPINAAIESNTITGNDYGLYLENRYAGTITADLGNGPLGSLGLNTIHSNTTLDVYNASGEIVSAEYNWWGDLNPADQVGGPDPVDFTPWLLGAP